MNRRIVAVPGVPQRNYSRLKAGGPGTVFYLETPAGGGAATLQRYRLSDRRAAPFLTGVADYVISADTHKMLYRGGGGGGGRGGGRGGGEPAAGPALFIVDADRNAPQPGAGRLTVQLRMYLDRKAEYKQIFKRRLAQSARLPVRAEHARRGLEPHGRDVRPDPAVRESPR